MVVDAAFAELFPQATSYAESYIYNSIPMLAQRLQDTSLTTTAGSRSVSLYGTALPCIVPQRVALQTTSVVYLYDNLGNILYDDQGNPLTSSPGPATTIPFQPVSLDFIDMYWPNESQTWAPANSLANYWCIEGGISPNDFTSPTIILAPTPDAAYTVVLTGLFQEAPLSQSNPQTYLTTNYAPLYTACCMVFISGALLRNYSSQGGTTPDEPGMPVSWQLQVDRLLGLAREEEARRRGFGTDYLDRLPSSSLPPPPGRAA